MRACPSRCLLHGSFQIVKSLASGESPAVPRFAWPVVHVKDVALAHLRALERPKASGRYILAEDKTSTSMLDMARKCSTVYCAHSNVLTYTCTVLWCLLNTPGSQSIGVYLGLCGPRQSPMSRGWN